MIDPLQDGKSRVALVDHMGDDQSIVRAARVSFGKDREEFSDERNIKLIRYMLVHGHGSPFEHNAVTLAIRCPIFVDRHLVKYRAGVSKNEESARYTEVKEEYYVPLAFRGQAKSNRQASVEGGLAKEDEALSRDLYRESILKAFETYRTLLTLGVAREQARGVLPLTAYVSSYYTFNLRSLFHVIKQRDTDDAQWETRQYAKAFREIVRPLFPLTFRAMEDA